MENCLCHPPSAPSTAPQPPSIPNASRRFEAVRRAVLAEFASVVVAGGHPIQQLALSHPQALGNVIPEAWSLISEILAFYDVLITRDLFIGSATTRVALQQLSDLLGYLPMPSVAAETHVALVGSQTETPTSTLGLTLRASLPSPQVFEPDQIKTLSWIPRTATIAPVRDTVVSVNESSKTIKILLEAATAAPQRNSPVLFLYGYHMRATEILGVKPSQELDGQDYVEVIVANPKTFEPALSTPFLLGDDVEVQDVSILSPSQRAYVRTDMLGDVAGAIDEADKDLSKEEVLKHFEYKPGGYGPTFQSFPPAGTLSTGQTVVELDGVYRSIKTADLVILQKGAYYSPHRVVNTIEILKHIGETGIVEEDANKPQIPITVITLNPPLPGDLKDGLTSSKLIIHYNLHDIGRLMRPAQSELDPNELIARGKLELEGVHRTPGSKPYSGQWLLEDANGRGTLVDATMEMDADTTRGKATLKITKYTGPATKLRTPIVAHPNILHVTRGETVKDELLGSGDPSIPSQSFELKKSPLTYVRAATERGIASTLEVRVDGVLWHEVRTFYGAGPNDHIYIVRQDEDEHSTVTFGDGVRGARLPAGARVRATYRFGAGAASPPAANLTQIVRGIPGLVRVRSPLAATGGDDQETARVIRKAAPASALVLGRCVSLSDFSARVANFSGVRNSRVELAWDEAMLAAVVTVWYVPTTPDDPHLAADIVGDLQKLSDPGTIIKAKQAEPVSLTLVIEIAVSKDYVATDVAAAARDALLDPDTGPLAISNIPIGSGGLSRSAIAAAVIAIPGVLDITRIYDLKPDDITEIPGPGIRIFSGKYLDFSGKNANQLFVEVTATTERDCCDSGS